MAVTPQGSIVIFGEGGLSRVVNPGVLGTILTSAGEQEDPSYIPPAEVINGSWPLGSLFIACIGTDPSEMFGFGIWEFLFTGKLFVGDNAIEVWTWKRVS